MLLQNAAAILMKLTDLYGKMSCLGRAPIVGKNADGIKLDSVLEVSNTSGEVGSMSA
jgi:hypothetical protein